MNSRVHILSSFEAIVIKDIERLIEKKVKRVTNKSSFIQQNNVSLIAVVHVNLSCRRHCSSVDDSMYITSRMTHIYHINLYTLK